MEVTVPASTGTIATPTPSAAPASATPKQTFTSFQQLQDSPGNIPDEAHDDPIEAESDKATPEAKEAKVDQPDGEVKDPKPAKEKKEAKPPPAQKHKVKVDGAETELDLEEIIAGYQRAASSTKRAQEAARVRHETEQLRGELIRQIEALKQDPDYALKQLGYSNEQIKQYADAQLRREMELAKLSPKDRAIMERDQQIRDLQSQQEQYQRQIQQQQYNQQQAVQAQAHQAEINRYASELDQQLPVVLAKHGLPATPTSAAMLARVMDWQIAAGNHEFSLEDAAALVREEMHSWTHAILRDDLPVDTLRAILPEKALAKIREAAIREANRAPEPQQQAQQGKPAATKKQPKQKSFTSFAELYKDDLYAQEADPVIASLVR